MKNKISFLLKILVTIILICLFYGNKDIINVFRQVKDINIGSWIILTIVILGVVFLNSYRWKMILSECHYLDLLFANFKASFFGLVLPGQLVSEGSKIFLLKDKNVDKTRITTSVFLDKILGFIPIVFLGVVGIAFSSISFSKSVLISFTLLSLLSFISLYFIKLPIVKDKIMLLLTTNIMQKKYTRKISNFFIKIIIIWGDNTKSFFNVIACIGISFITQLLSIFTGWLIAIDVGVSIPFIEWFWIDAYTTVAILLPISIAGIGVREGALCSSFSLFGVEEDKALVVSAVIMLLQIIRAIVGVIVFVFDKEGYSNEK